MECVDDAMNQDNIMEEVVDPNCGLHMSCTSSFANFQPYSDQADHSMCRVILFTGAVWFKIDLPGE